MLTPTQEDFQNLLRILNDFNSLLKSESVAVRVTPTYQRIQSNLLNLNKKYFGEIKKEIKE
jgi:hypothetical protein